MYSAGGLRSVFCIPTSWMRTSTSFFGTKMWTSPTLIHLSEPHGHTRSPHDVGLLEDFQGFFLGIFGDFMWGFFLGFSQGLVLGFFGLFFGGFFWVFFGYFYSGFFSLPALHLCLYEDNCNIHMTDSPRHQGIMTMSTHSHHLHRTCCLSSSPAVSGFGAADS